MRTLTASLVLLALSGCHIEVDTGARREKASGGDADDMDLRTPANDEGCFPGELAAESALCLCEGLDDVGRLQLLESESGQAASLGVNGHVSVVSNMTIEGSLFAHGGFDGVLHGSVRDDISTAGSFTWVGKQRVNGDLNVGGSVDGVGDLEVLGTLRVGGGVAVVGDVSAGARAPYVARDEPCACSGDAFFNVGIAVADAAQLNDNDAVELDEKLERVGAGELRLPSGRYYLSSWSTVGTTRIVAEGEVALFVGGSMDHVGDEQLEVAEGGSLDLYVQDGVASVGNIAMGNADPSAFRLLVGGHEVVSVGEQVLSGYLYAPRAGLSFVGETTIHGAVFARRLEGVGELTIRYQGGAKTADATCDDVPVEEPR